MFCIWSVKGKCVHRIDQESWSNTFTVFLGGHLLMNVCVLRANVHIEDTKCIEEHLYWV